MPFTPDATLVSLEDVLTKATPGTTFTLCESVGRNHYKFCKRWYPGDWEDLTSVAVVGLLEWVKGQPNKEELVESEVLAVLNRAVRRELSEQYKQAVFKEADLALTPAEDGTVSWNPEDTRDQLTPERATLLTSASLSLAQVVGEDEALILRLKLVEGLTNAQIKKRFQVDLPTLGVTAREARLLGYPCSGKRRLSEEQIEDIVTQALATAKEYFGADGMNLTKHNHSTAVRDCLRNILPSRKREQSERAD